MAALEKFDALIIDPDLSTRIRLKQATTAVPQFGRVHQLGGMREASDKLQGRDICNVIFISNRIEQAEITEFIKLAKTTPCGQDAAYILVLAGKNQDSTTVAANVMIGADGFLFEPYSVDSLVEITNLAARVKKERGREREQAALKFLMGDVINQIDIIAQLKASGMDMGPNMKRLKEMCTVFLTLEKESLDAYYIIASDKFENAPVPKLMAKKYGGASSRVKKRQDAKATDALQKAAAAAATTGETKV